ncbi:hypothetical protein [Occallatibacter savannae]|uniref:hypothetical protein n=1 Tax=Occallatibacter savannae TaxID=1002691 RepID=UPI000D69EF3B|nr:hypothetical protein [Occallatibacter savannae]
MLKRLLVMTFALFVAGHMWAAEDPFVGKWKLNASKSSFTGMQMKIEDLGGNKYRITSGGTSDTITADGTDQAASDGSTGSIAPDGPNAWKMVIKRNGKVVSSMTHTLSADGSTQTIKGTGYKPDGSGSDFTVILKRVGGGSGWAGTWEDVKIEDNSSHELHIEQYQESGLTFKSPDYAATVSMNFDGKDYGESGPDASQDDAFSGKRVGAGPFELTFKIKGKVIENRKYSVSPDGKTLTITTQEVDQPRERVAVYDKL